MSIQILVVDDHPLVRDGLVANLKAEPDFAVVGECGDGKAAIDFVSENEVDLILMDINMSPIDGIEASKQILALKPDTLILALSMSNESEYIKKMFQVGARGYLLKDSTKAQIIEGINTLLRGEMYYSKEVQKSVMESLMPHNQLGQTESELIPLTEREKEVLRLIANQYSNKEIAEKLFISVRTVDAHRRSLLEKTNAKNAAGLAVFAVRHNII
ncbi:MAG: response regulator transcription factor [Bacteroidota bacterium]